jgi:DNA-directed RNA polymerase subunit M/transcription elongation factor TFIIS
MMILKGCPRCKGDLYIDRDLDGTYISCMQCGYVKDVDDERSSLRVRVKKDLACRGHQRAREHAEARG